MANLGSPPPNSRDYQNGVFYRECLKEIAKYLDDMKLLPDIVEKIKVSVGEK